MEYPLISEYREAILSAEDNLNELSFLRPVLDNHGDPVMSSGNFAVVFKMKDERDGRLYALKCFIKLQEGRDESYRKIADELEIVSLSHILPFHYIDKELFVDTSHCQEEEFPVVVMEWVEGETLDAYLNRNLQNNYELEMLSYRFNRMAAWLLAQPFAHGDLKPDNILVRDDGSLVLVDYDGMFVPSMKGEKAREIGSPDYRHPLRNDSDFNEHIDDFSISVIALSLKAIALDPELKSDTDVPEGDSLLLTESDFRNLGQSRMLQKIQQLTSNPDLALLMGVFYIAHSKHSLENLSFRLFMTDKPQRPVIVKPQHSIDTKVTEEDIKNGIEDEYGVIYSKDGKRLLKCPNGIRIYTVKSGTMIICDKAFYSCISLQDIKLPDSVTSIGDHTFCSCRSLQSIGLPDSVTIIGDNAFSFCRSLQSIKLPNSLTSIGDGAFSWCSSLKSVTLPDSLTNLGNSAFSSCSSLKSVTLPDSLTNLGDGAFFGCSSLQSVTLPDSLTSLGSGTFSLCSSFRSITLPDSLTSIGNNPFGRCDKLILHISIKSKFSLLDNLLIDKTGRLISCLNSSKVIEVPYLVTTIGAEAFYGCHSLQGIALPDSLTNIGDDAFSSCIYLRNITLPDSVTSIGVNPFRGCNHLSLHISIKSKFSLLDNLLIDNAGRLISCLNSSKVIELPESVTNIGDYAFAECNFLQRLRLPDSVTNIGDDAFYWCKSLQSITLPDSLKSIGKRAFEGCAALQSVTLPASVTNIGNDAFPKHCKVIRK